MSVKLGVSLSNVNKCPFCGCAPDWTKMTFVCGFIARPLDEYTLDIYTKCAVSEDLLPEFAINNNPPPSVEGKCICTMDQIMRTGCSCGGK